MYLLGKIQVRDRENRRSLGQSSRSLRGSLAFCSPLKSWFEGLSTIRRVLLYCHLSVSHQWRNQQTDGALFSDHFSNFPLVPYPSSERVDGTLGQRCQRQRQRGLNWGLNRETQDFERTSESLGAAVGGGCLIQL